MRTPHLATLLFPLSIALTAVSLLSRNAIAEQVTITRLVLRNYEIEISQSVNGETLYDVSSLNGQARDLDLSEGQMQAKYPEVYDHLRPAVADESSSMLMMELVEMD